MTERETPISILSLNDILLQLQQGKTEGSGTRAFGIQGDIEANMGWHRDIQPSIQLDQHGRLEWLLKFFDVADGKIKDWLQGRIVEVFDDAVRVSDQLSPEDSESLQQLEDEYFSIVKSADANNEHSIAEIAQAKKKIAATKTEIARKMIAH